MDGAPKKEYAALKYTLREILPLLENEKSLLCNKVRLTLLTEEAEARIKEGRMDTTVKISGKRGWVSGTAFFGGLGMIVWGQVFGEASSWCENILKVTGIATAVGGAFAWLKGVLDFGATIDFPVQVALLIDDIRKALWHER